MNSPKRVPTERKSKRLKVFEPAVVVQGPRESRAHLLNVTISCGAVRLTGRIVWTEEHRSGVRFVEPIGEAVMAALLRSIETNAKG